MYRNRILLVSIWVSLLNPPIVHPGEVLPEELCGWKLREGKVFPGRALFDYIDGGAELYFEYGFTTAYVGYYQKEEQELVVEIYQMASPLAALGIYSVTKDVAAPSLPEPYTGKLYDLYLECLNGREFVKFINYDPIPEQDRLAILKKLIPEPQTPAKVELFSWLPEKRIPGSEMYFNGPLSLRNFSPVLGRSNIFEVGKKTKAVGCLVKGRDKPFRWLIVAGDETNLRQGKERLVKTLNQKEYRMEIKEGYQLLEDGASGSNILIINKGTRLHFVFGIQRGDVGKLLDLIQKP